MSAVVYLTATWCSPCRTLKPKLIKIAEDLDQPIYIDPDQIPASGLAVVNIETKLGTSLMESINASSVPRLVIDGADMDPANTPWPTVKKIVQEALA